MAGADEKKVQFIGTSHKDLLDMPAEVRGDIGYALDFAENGKKHPSAKPLKGFHGSGVVEIVARHDTNTYRGMYTVKFEDMVYVLHCFQKKSKTGGKMTQQDKELIQSRLNKAREQYEARSKS